MMSLPRSIPGITYTNPQGNTSFHPRRNIPDTPFRQFSHYGLTKRGFMPYSSFDLTETVLDEIKLLNYGNYQQHLILRTLMT